MFYFWLNAFRKAMLSCDTKKNVYSLYVVVDIDNIILVKAIRLHSVFTPINVQKCLKKISMNSRSLRLDTIIIYSITSMNTIYYTRFRYWKTPGAIYYNHLTNQKMPGAIYYTIFTTYSLWAQFTITRLSVLQRYRHQRSRQSIMLEINMKLCKI